METNDVTNNSRERAAAGPTCVNRQMMHRRLGTVSVGTSRPIAANGRAATRSAIARTDRPVGCDPGGLYRGNGATSRVRAAGRRDAAVPVAQALDASALASRPSSTARNEVATCGARGIDSWRCVSRGEFGGTGGAASRARHQAERSRHPGRTQATTGRGARQHGPDRPGGLGTSPLRTAS